MRNTQETKNHLGHGNRNTLMESEGVKNVRKGVVNRVERSRRIRIKSTC